MSKNETIGAEVPRAIGGQVMSKETENQPSMAEMLKGDADAMHAALNRPGASLTHSTIERIVERMYAAAARIADLESIVSSLPHIDGKPVTPGTMLYSRLPDGSIGISWADMTESDEPVVHGDTNGYAPLDFDGFYLEDPTAAEAARTQEQEKTR